MDIKIIELRARQLDQRERKYQPDEDYFLKVDTKIFFYIFVLLEVLLDYD